MHGNYFGAGRLVMWRRHDASQKVKQERRFGLFEPAPEWPSVMRPCLGQRCRAVTYATGLSFSNDPCRSNGADGWLSNQKKKLARSNRKNTDECRAFDGSKLFFKAPFG